MYKEQTQIKFDTLKAEYAKQVARMHAQGIYEGFISSLGEKFIEYLYEGIIASDQAFGFVAIKNNRVVGFISCVENVGAIYKYILKRHFFRLILTILPKVFRFYNLKNVIETLFYPMRSGDNLPCIEILAVVVAERVRKMGLGRKLIEQVYGESNRRGIKRVKVMVGEPLPANEFYKHLGFQLKDQYRHHGHLTNSYVIAIGNNAQSQMPVV